MKIQDEYGPSTICAKWAIEAFLTLLAMAVAAAIVLAVVS